MRNSAIISAIEQFASPSLQEKWDNTGWQVGSGADECTGVLVCLEPTPAIVAEAIDRKCNLIVSHHPLFFRPLKKLTGSDMVQVTALAAIRAGISIYSSHTASDSTPGGVSYALANKIGVRPIKALAPMSDRLVQLQVIVPNSHVEDVQIALFDAGAGKLGNYDRCSFQVQGQGTFRALDGANPHVGDLGKQHFEEETSLNMVVSIDKVSQVENALLQAHPYETPAYMFTPMLNKLADTGLGVYGIFDGDCSASEFAEHVKTALGCAAVRTSKVDDDPNISIRRVAMCGGAGAEFIPAAIAMGAQAYVTADLKYHDFVNYRDRILLIDAGHYETEAPIKQIFCDLIKDKFPTVPVFATSTNDNPINYI